MFWKPNITLKKGSVDPTITLEQYTLLSSRHRLLYDRDEFVDNFVFVQ